MPAKKLSPEQSQDAQRLAKLFEAWQQQQKDNRLPWSQEKALALGDFGFGQSAFSQYLNGTIPLNTDAASKFARFLKCQVEDFSPAIAIEIASQWPFQSISRERFAALTESQKNQIEGAMQLMMLRFSDPKHQTSPAGTAIAQEARKAKS